MSQFFNPDPNPLFTGALILKDVHLVHFHVLPSCTVALSNDFLLCCLCVSAESPDRQGVE